MGFRLKKAADSFDQVKEMATRKLPVPDLGGTEKFIQFTAKRTKGGHWVITSKNNLSTVTAGLQATSRAYQSALTKHEGRTKDGEMNFDTAFLILRDMEESLLKYSGLDKEAGEEPRHHYMSVWRLLPEGLRKNLDNTYFGRANTPILPHPGGGAAPASHSKPN